MREEEIEKRETIEKISSSDRRYVRESRERRERREKREKRGTSDTTYNR